MRKVTTYSIREEVIKAVQEAAKEQNRSASNLVENILIEWLKNK